MEKQEKAIINEQAKAKDNMPKMRTSKLNAVVCSVCGKEISDSEKKRNDGKCNECKNKNISVKHL